MKIAVALGRIRRSAETAGPMVSSKYVRAVSDQQARLELSGEGPVQDMV